MITNATHRGFPGGKQAWMLGAGALAAMAVGSAGVASAASISWQTPQTISGVTDISTTGTTVWAWAPAINTGGLGNYGGGNYAMEGPRYGPINPVLNGVTYTSSNASYAGVTYNGGLPPPGLTTSSPDYVYNQYNNGPFNPNIGIPGTGTYNSAALPALLDQLPNVSGSGSTPAAGTAGANYMYALALSVFQWSPTNRTTGFPELNYTMSGLTVGHTYLVQAWLADHNGFSETLSGSTSDAAYLDGYQHQAPAGASLGGYMGAYVIGTFTATGTTQALNIYTGHYDPATGITVTNNPLWGTNHGALLSMLQLRDVTATTPEPTTLGLMALGALGLLLKPRKRNAGSLESGIEPLG